MDFEEYLWAMGDTGLLVTQMMRNSDETGDNLYKSLVFDKLGINQGMIIENMVAQMLRASGHDLYNKSPSAEYEFHTLRKGIFFFFFLFIIAPAFFFLFSYVCGWSFPEHRNRIRPHT